MSELTKRIIVAAFGIPIALILIYIGSVPFFVAIIVLSSLALLEFYSLAEQKGISPKKYIGLGFAILFQFVFLISFKNYFSINPFMFAVIIFLSFTMIMFFAELFRPSKTPIESISVTIAGIPYVVFFFITIYILREFDLFLKLFHNHIKVIGSSINYDLLLRMESIPNEKWGGFILVMFSSIWLCDSAAFFVGKAFGKNKLYEKVSPKKTIEGAVGGLVFAIIAFIGIGYLLVPELTIFHLAICGVIVGTIGQAGDLAESLLKRDAKVKDSSDLIPGHGGILDRFDSILFVAPSIFIYFCAILYFG